jgi:hypothetical protein
MFLVSLVSNSDQRLNQNVLRNLLSWSEMMVCGIPKWTHTSSKKILVVYVAVIFFLQAMRMRSILVFHTLKRMRSGCEDEVNTLFLERMRSTLYSWQG